METLILEIVQQFGDVIQIGIGSVTGYIGWRTYKSSSTEDKQDKTIKELRDQNRKLLDALDNINENLSRRDNNDGT